MLVAASIALFGSPVTFTQWFGYSIALAGMVYYKLGYNQIAGYARDGSRMWAEYGTTNPAQRKMVIFGAVILFLFLLVGGLGTASGVTSKDAVEKGSEMFKGITGGGKTGN